MRGSAKNGMVTYSKPSMPASGIRLSVRVAGGPPIARTRWKVEHAAQGLRLEEPEKDPHPRRADLADVVHLGQREVEHRDRDSRSLGWMNSLDWSSSAERLSNCAGVILAMSCWMKRGASVASVMPATPNFASPALTTKTRRSTASQ